MKLRRLEDTSSDDKSRRVIKHLQINYPNDIQLSPKEEIPSSDYFHRALRLHQLNYNFFTLIQCYSCFKWRYIPQSDPTLRIQFTCDQLEYLECHDPLSSDDLSGEPNPSRYSEIIFIPGTFVWVKLKLFRWWPAMIDYCPDKLTFFISVDKSKLIPNFYHVVFPSLDHPTRSWVEVERIQILRDFDTHKNPKIQFKDNNGIFRSIFYI